MNPSGRLVTKSRAVAAILCVAAGTAFLVRDELVTQERYARFYQGYGRLSAGMHKSYVHSSLGRPAYSCRYRASVIEYFVPPERFWQNPFGLTRSWDITPELPVEARELDEIPHVYGAVKVAFDANERVVAFEWNSHLGATLTGSMVALDP